MPISNILYLSYSMLNLHTIFWFDSKLSYFSIIFNWSRHSIIINVRFSLRLAFMDIIVFIDIDIPEMVYRIIPPSPLFIPLHPCEKNAVIKRLYDLFIVILKYLLLYIKLIFIRLYSGDKQIGQCTIKLICQFRNKD